MHTNILVQAIAALLVAIARNHQWDAGVDLDIGLSLDVRAHASTRRAKRDKKLE